MGMHLQPKSINKAALSNVSLSLSCFSLSNYFNVPMSKSLGGNRVADVKAMEAWAAAATLASQLVGAGTIVAIHGNTQ